MKFAELSLHTRFHFVGDKEVYVKMSENEYSIACEDELITTNKVEDEEVELFDLDKKEEYEEALTFRFWFSSIHYALKATNQLRRMNKHYEIIPYNGDAYPYRNYRCRIVCLFRKDSFRDIVNVVKCCMEFSALNQMLVAENWIKLNHREY